MSFPSTNLGNVRAPKIIAQEHFSRQFTKQNEAVLIALLHAITQVDDDRSFPCLYDSLGSVEISCSTEDMPTPKVLLSFSFNGNLREESFYAKRSFSLVSDNDEAFIVNIKTLPAELYNISTTGNFNISLNRDLELSYAILCFFQYFFRKDNKMQKCVACEKNIIQNSNIMSCNPKVSWKIHLEQIERVILSTLEGGYNHCVSEDPNLSKIPGIYHEYLIWLGYM